MHRRVGRYDSIYAVFEWDDANVQHIAEHHVTPDEAEEVFADRRQFSVPAYHTPTERRAAIVGATEEDRVLYIVYTRRADRIRVITARDADPILWRRYRRR